MLSRWATWLSACSSEFFLFNARICSSALVFSETIFSWADLSADSSSLLTFISWLSRSSFSFFTESSDPKSIPGGDDSRSCELRSSFSFLNISQISCDSWYEVSRRRTSFLSLSHSLLICSAADSTSIMRSLLASNWFFKSLFSWSSLLALSLALLWSLFRFSTSFSRIFLSARSFSMATIMLS